MSEHILTLGNVVKLKQPYRPQQWIEKKPHDWRGFEFGIVAEFADNEKVSLFLYDFDGQLLVTPSLVQQALLMPTYVEFDLVELVLYKILSESGHSQNIE